uniref:Integrase catalytic domain-containing protein n=1 Tax=Amphimedon queenslandica TaxID=400682 RepID=A0A1X7UBW2_AMPQE
DVLRFLWVTDPYQEPAEIQVLRFKRVTFGVTVNPFLLNATMRYHIESYKEERPNVVERLLQSAYDDDVVCGTESAESFVEMFEKFRAMLSTGGFNLRKFVTSGQSVAGGSKRQPVIVPRCYFEEVSDHWGCRLIGFSDSSAKAYAAVVYLQWDRGDSKRMAFIASKTRVAPLKSLTIPRLELLGALLLVRLINCVHEALREELKLLPSRCYTDSQVALYWIQGERKEWKPFVCNRVKEIRKLISSGQWSHCHGKQNPAYTPSRGMSVEELRACTLWWEGPKDLGAEENICDQMPGECLDEMRARRGHFTELIIRRGRTVVRRLIHTCVTCRRLEGQSYAVPPMPPQPTYRVSERPPFYYTGVDFARPIFVKNSAYELGGKAWLCPYTCCITRAIHLDLLHNMSFEYFFRSFKRFVARRGLPRKMLSDNAQTFKKMASLLKEIEDHKDVKHYFSDRKIQWNFNVEMSPWWGEVFERLIQSVKRCMKKVIGRASLTYEELLTAVIEIEMIINSLPLSYVTQDDLDEPITPSHLLIGRRLTSLPDDICCTEDDFTLTPPTLTRRIVSKLPVISFLEQMEEGISSRVKRSA